MSKVINLQPKEPFNRQSAEHFLTLLDEGTETFCFQTFDDYKSRGDKSLARVFHGSPEEHWASLCELSSRGAGIFVTINRTNGRGRKKANIVAIRALWRELGRPGVPELLIEPHVIVESSAGKFHEYLLVRRV